MAEIVRSQGRPQLVDGGAGVVAEKGEAVEFFLGSIYRHFQGIAHEQQEVAHLDDADTLRMV